MKKLTGLYIFFFFLALQGRTVLAVQPPDIDIEYPDLIGEGYTIGGEYSDDKMIEYYDDEFDQMKIYDPLEPLNRVFFVFNDKLYFWVLKPVKTGYSYVVPNEFRECFANFFNNLTAPIRLVNTLLQGRFKDAGIVFSRFLINTTAGVYGFADTAYTEYGLEPKRADLGQTFGVYGIGEGIYFCWPVLGPSHLRHTVGFAGDSFVSPLTYFDLTTEGKFVYSTSKRINTLSLQPGLYEDLVKFSLDPYVSARQSFYDFRRNMVKKADGYEQIKEN